MPDNFTSTIGFGYQGIVICESCYRPNHIFVESDRKREYCLHCHDKYTNQNDDVRLPNTETHSILADEIPTCQVCEMPAIEDSINWYLRDAYLADSTTIIKAHMGCSNKFCDNCDLMYANNNNRNWHRDYQVPSSQITSSTRIEGDYNCDSCNNKFWETHDESEFFECECCESHTHDNNAGWFNGSKYCEACIEEYVYECSNCSESRWEGDDHDCEYDDDDNDNDQSLIHSYSYRPSPFFFGEGKYHFGFELEVEARSNNRYEGALMVQNTLGGHAYMKEDASISDGFEIVTHPHTLEKYHTDFNWEVLDKLKREGYRSWNTSSCGIHVHVSRTAFGDGDPWNFNVTAGTRSQLIIKRQSHELRFMKLIYDNQRQVERIAGRSSEHYASFQDRGKLVRKVKNGYQENGRFSAVNTENDDTIEVRVFKGSLRKERVLSAIEFVHASVEYTRSIKVTNKNHALSWLKFTGYVSDNSDMYPNLVTIMSESFANDTTPDESN